MVNTSNIQELYEKYGFLIYGRCLRILGTKEDAQDAMQTVFMQLLKNYDKIRKADRIVPWIFITAKNLCFNILRDRRKFSGSTTEEHIPHNDRFDDRYGAQEMINLILEQHDPKVRDAVYYTHIENLKQEEIRKVTGQSPATIRRNLQRFKKSIPHLKKKLGF
jgi:RNA polymerase sigma-70 factor, ECF subfamily